MSRVVPKSLVIAAALLVGIGLMPTSADAARLTKAERAAYNRANVSCKAEAKAKKLGWHWLKRRKFIRDCIVETLKGYPNIDVEKITKEMDTGRLPVDVGGNAI